MATRSFLSEKYWQDALENLRPNDVKFSTELERHLLERLSSHEEWERAEPIALGSWARGELCPKSDIDLLFVGDEKAAASLVKKWQADGLKIRSRIPEDPTDWTVGVEPFDVLALLFARPLAEAAAPKLKAQVELLQADIKTWRKHWLKAMTDERKLRAQRYDSISNYLEPNIKYGPGGLRDLQQALYLYALFPEKFENADHFREHLENSKKFLLTLRQRLHLQGGQDMLVASEQNDIARWLGFIDVFDFMRDLQSRLDEVSFWADWSVECARSSLKKIKEAECRELDSPAACFLLLENDPGLLNQGVVRERGLQSFKKLKKIHRKKLGPILTKYFTPDHSLEFLVALFRSHIMYECVPELKRLAGLVQHDQYHRYTADAHILQAVKTFKRIQKNPRHLGPLSSLTKEFNDQDWRVLLWTCLYHDIAKGRPGDHSTVGAKIVKKDFVERGISLRLTVETAWMVENHLALSTAAFRQNPQSPSTWRKLHQKGVEGKALLRLAVFTVIDIVATNPEAWNEWKGRLLADLVNVIRSRRATKFMQLLASATNAKIKLSREFISGMDPALVEAVPTKRLIEEYHGLKKKKGDLPILVHKGRAGELWVRFHSREDKSGLFLSFVSWLGAAGCSIEASSVQTFSSYGVYDWFKVRSKKTPAKLKKLLEVVQKAGAPVQFPKVSFDQVSIVSEDQEDLVISFRGKNQSGLLLTAARALYQSSMPIKWAKVHTWGRQIDDIFCVKRPQDTKKALDDLRQELNVSGSGFET